jgi:hypothetical protein
MICSGGADLRVGPVYLLTRQSPSSLFAKSLIIGLSNERGGSHG